MGGARVQQRHDQFIRRLAEDEECLVMALSNRRQV